MRDKLISIKTKIAILSDRWDYLIDKHIWLFIAFKQPQDKGMVQILKEIKAVKPEIKQYILTKYIE